MKDKKRVKIISLVVLLVLILVVIGVVSFKKNYVKKANNQESKQEGVIYNTNEQVITDKTVNDILFTNIKCYYDGYNSLIEYDIINKSSKAINLGEYEIVVKDKNGKVLANLSPVLDVNIEVGDSYHTGNAIDIDLSTAYAMEIVLSD